MSPELEALLKQRPKHRQQFIPWRGPLCLRDNIETIVVQPLRTTNDPSRREVVSNLDQGFRCDVGDRHPFPGSTFTRCKASGPDLLTLTDATSKLQLYAQHCSRCHGADLTGMAIIPPWPSGRDRTPALGVNLFNDLYYDLPLSDLVERIRISMPQDRPGSLDRKRTVDVVAYLLLQSGFPLGRSELSDRLEHLRTTQIVPYKR